MRCAKSFELAVQKTQEQTRDIIAALAQRRYVNFVAGEAVQEGRAKLARADEGLEIGVGCGDDSDVDFFWPLCAEGKNLAGLYGAQEHGLHVDWNLADLVEEERAAIGRRRK